MLFYRGTCYLHSILGSWVSIDNLHVTRSEASLAPWMSSLYSKHNGFIVTGGSFQPSSESLTLDACSSNGQCQWSLMTAALPEGLQNHCSVNLGNNSILLIGGQTTSVDYSAKTYILSTTYPIFHFFHDIFRKFFVRHYIFGG